MTTTWADGLTCPPKRKASGVTRPRIKLIGQFTRGQYRTRIFWSEADTLNQQTATTRAHSLVMCQKIVTFDRSIAKILLICASEIQNSVTYWQSQSSTEKSQTREAILGPSGNCHKGQLWNVEFPYAK
ncbi:hypothetical protein EVAR_26406_1 [Eumeta japonica]|uniref:Uncharacterized protein n=1 Tax=Eumeta variegata TaxID=151549 RepID=A0A4C1VQ10_EUMVA|nr:hypothetical protein EVAR_26406_1 [Eumeta japonica]